jgi:antitoxin ChpS
MHTARLHRVGGSTMLAVPPDILKMLHLQPEDSVTLMVESGRLVVEPRQRSPLTFAELLTESDYSQPPSAEERAWLDADAVGREPL